MRRQHYNDYKGETYVVLPMIGRISYIFFFVPLQLDFGPYYKGRSIAFCSSLV
jgi:hypothetical protein